MRRLLVRLSRGHRRFVFALLAAAVLVPFFFPITTRPKAGQQTKRFFEALNAAVERPGPVLICVDYGPQTLAEMEPILVAVMHRIFSVKKPAVFMTLLPEAAAPTRRLLQDMAQRYDLKYGVDYAFLGYASAFAMAINAMGTSIEDYFHKDDRGLRLGELPIMSHADKLGDFSAVIDVASNSMPQFWISYGVAPFGFEFLMACTAVQATDYFPYVQTGQVDGLIAGGRAGAELEWLLVDAGVVKKTGDATRALGSQSLALAVIFGLIVLGNLGHFAARFPKKGWRK